MVQDNRIVYVGTWPDGASERRHQDPVGTANNLGAAVSEFPMTIGDVLASKDVLVDVADHSDSMTAEECVEFRVACEYVRKAVNDAIMFLDMQFCRIAEIDVIRDGRRFYVSRKKEHERFDHSAITAEIMAVAAEANDDPTFLAGVRLGIDAMQRLYVSDGTRVKIGGLDYYGIPHSKNHPDSVRSWSPGDKYVAIVPAGGER